MSTVAGTINQAWTGRRRHATAAGALFVSFGLRFAAIAGVAMLVAVVILTALFLANLDTLLVGLLTAQDPILIPVREGSVVN